MLLVRLFISFVTLIGLFGFIGEKEDLSLKSGMLLIVLCGLASLVLTLLFN